MPQCQYKGITTKGNHSCNKYDGPMAEECEIVNGRCRAKTDISVNKFVTSFEFLQEDDEVGSESYLTNEAAYNFSDAYSLRYRTRRNEKTDFTEFYNLIYEYKNDCLTASIQYNKDYYSDNELKPTEEIFFSISIVPLTTLNTPSVR